LVPVNIEQIDEKSVNKYSVNNHLIISPVHKKGKIAFKPISENAIITGINFDFDIQEIDINPSSPSKESNFFNKISFVNIKNKRDHKEKSKSMTINDLIKLIRQKSMDSTELKNNIHK
jgi:hypothetical protein